MNAFSQVLRIVGDDRAFAFYTEYLSFRWDWPQRFGDHEPVYAQVTRDTVKLQLSEHHGDASPGAAVVLITPGNASRRNHFGD